MDVKRRGCDGAGGVRVSEGKLVGEFEFGTFGITSYFLLASVTSLEMPFSG